MKQKLRVWWIAQVGQDSDSFYVPVENVVEAKRVMDILAAYDAYQLQNNIKPDYCNVGGLQMLNVETGEWEDWYTETEDGYYFDDIDEYLEEIGKSDEYEQYLDELYGQIDWSEINARNYI